MEIDDDVNNNDAKMMHENEYAAGDETIGKNKGNIVICNNYKYINVFYFCKVSECVGVAQV